MLENFRNDDTAILHFMEGDVNLDDFCQEVEEHINTYKDLWLLAKMTKEIKYTNREILPLKDNDKEDHLNIIQ